MSAAREAAVCQRLDCWLSAYVDGELDAVHCMEVEDHIAQCDVCCEHVGMLHAAKVSVQHTASECAPQSLRERVCRTLLDERVAGAPDDVATTRDLSEPAEDSGNTLTAPVEREDAAPAPAGKVATSEARRGDAPAYLNTLRYIVPLAAAATIALVVGAMSLGGLQQEGPPIATTATDSPAIAANNISSFDTLLDDLVTQHAHPPQLDVTDPNEPLELRPILDQHLRGTRYEQDFGATYVGARKTPRAGMLQYVKRNKNRMTMYVFNTRRVKVHSDKLTSRRIGARKVYVGKVKAYPVAVSERDGVGFALTADDLSAEEASNLVLAASE